MRVLWIIPYRMQAVLDKGEVVDRYFNPGNVASQISFMTWRRPPTDLDKLQRMAGDAQIKIHYATFRGCWSGVRNLPSTYDLIRTCTRIGGEMAVRSKTPSLISVHCDRRRCVGDMPMWARPVFWAEAQRQERICARATKCVITSEGYRHIAPDAEYIPNVVAEPRARVPTPNKVVLCVSRDIPGKGFEPMRGACKKLGRYLVTQGGGASNDSVMHNMARSRVVALRNHYPGLPKTVQEALLTGVPLVLNQEALKFAPELNGSPIWWCEDTVEGYAEAISKAWSNAIYMPYNVRDRFDPTAVEARWAEAYRETASCG